MGELGIGARILLLFADIMMDAAIKTLLPVRICPSATDRFGIAINGVIGRPPDFVFPSSGIFPISACG